MSKSYPFTLNNYTEEDCKFFAEYTDCHHLYVGAEVATTGTPHLQGYICWGSSKRWTAVQKIHEVFTRCAAQLVTMGKPSQNKDYCLKGDITKEEWVKWVTDGRDRNTEPWGRNVKVVADHCDISQGQRTDLDEFHSALKRGAEDAELFEEHLPVLAKYPRLENRIKMSVLKASTRPFRDVKVIVHWGEAGTGKTRSPYEQGAFIFDDYESGWWDGYDGESAILLDDFYGGIKWSFFLRLLDGYQCRLKVKGGFTYAQWTTVYITSNKHPDEWYKDHVLEDGAFKRRVSEVIKFEQSDVQFKQVIKTAEPITGPAF